MYVAVKGGQKAIKNAHDLLAARRRGDCRHKALELDQIDQQLGIAVDRVMTEGSLYDRRLAALAVKQAQGDLVEAIFLLRAFRTTLPRFGYSLALDTGAMAVRRRISAAYKDLPGGQLLGATYDYTHRLLDFSLAAEEQAASGMTDDRQPQKAEPSEPARPAEPTDRCQSMPRIADILAGEQVIETQPPDAPDADAPGDITRDPLNTPAHRSTRLQSLFRGDEGFVLGMGYSTQRGFGAGVHPFLGEIRAGSVAVSFEPEELGFPIVVGEIEVTECVMLHRFAGGADTPPRFVKGYGLAFGRCERKAMAMALVDRALRCRELGEIVDHPARNEEFMLFHSDNVEASGFVEHLKLPHHVDFQADLVLMRQLIAAYHRDRTEQKEKNDHERTSEHAA